MLAVVLPEPEVEVVVDPLLITYLGSVVSELLRPRRMAAASATDP